jgi:hypothetical protein
MVLDHRVGGRKEYALVAIAPADKIWWRAFLAMHFDDHSCPVFVTYVSSPDQQLIADICSHRSSLLSARDHHLGFRREATGQAGP